MLRSILLVTVFFLLQNFTFSQCFIPDYTHTYCPDDFILNLTLAEINGNGEYTYFENLTEIVNPVAYIAMGSTIIDGTFTENGTGCVAEFQVVVEEVILPEPNLEEEYFLTCNETSVLIQLDQPDDPLIDYIWIGPSGATLAVGPEVIIGQLGTYTLEISHIQQLCSVFIDFELSFNEDNIPDAVHEVIQNCDSTANIVLTPNLDTSDLIVNWFGSGITNSNDPFNVLVDQPGVYVFEMFNPVNGCAIVDSVDVTSLECMNTNTEWLFDEDAFMIYPNPSGGIFTIESYEFLLEEITIEVFNSIGNLIWKKDAQFNLTQLVDLQESPSGIYFIKIYSANQSLLEKVEKF